jgi:hypothetical protein
MIKFEFTTHSQIKELFKRRELEAEQLAMSAMTASKPKRGRGRPPKSDKKVKKFREPTKYNMFIKAHMPEIKARMPEIDNEECMKIAAMLWSSQLANNDF